MMASSIYLSDLAVFGHFYALRFASADKAAFLALKEQIKSYGTRWDTNVFSGRGGWLVEKAIFALVRHQFANAEEKLAELETASRRGSAVPRRLVPAYTMLALPLDHQATKDEVNIAYKRLSKLYHPDRGGEQGCAAGRNRKLEEKAGHLG